MLINTKTGAVTLAETTFSREVPFSRLSLPDGMTPQAVGSRSQHLVFVAIDKGHKFHVRVIYLDDRLNMAVFELAGHDLPPDELQKLHADYLRLCFGEPPYKYDWGQITAEINPRDDASSIVVNYS